MSKFLFYDDMLINVLLKEEKPSGGAAVQAYAWIRGLMAEGQEVSVMTNEVKEDQLKDECKDIPLIPLYENSKGIKWIRWLYYRIPYLFRTFRKVNPDYLIQGIPDWTSCVLAILCYSLKIKLIIRVSADNLIDERFFKDYSRMHKFFMNLGFSLSYAIICQNEYQHQILKKKYPKKKVVKFGNPFYNKSIMNIKSYKQKEYFAWVALFQYQKNMGLLFEIASKMKDEKFKIAGKENFVDIDNETKGYINKLHSLENVEFVGFLGRKKLLEFLENAKFLLSTSHFEGFSNTFLESMICGTPIITTKNANPDTIISKYNLGFIYSDQNDFSERYNLITPESYAKISNNTLEYVKKHHNYRILAKRLMKFLEAG